MIDIFINYRSTDEPFGALLIDKALSQRFGPDRVFRDSRTIRPGVDFPPEIWRALQESRVVVAVIGERWLRRDSTGRRRIDDPDDYVRREIAEALRRDIIVVPVLVGDASLPPAQDLPPAIAGLASRQYLHLRTRDADYDVLRMVNEFVDLLEGRRRSTEGVPTPLPGAGPAGDLVTNHFHDQVWAPNSVFGVNRGR